MQGDLTTTDPLHIHDVLIRQVPSFDTRGNVHQVTRVSIMVGAHGPFTEDFGPGRQRADTADAINQWKTEIVTKLASAGGGR